MHLLPRASSELQCKVINRSWRRNVSRFTRSEGKYQARHLFTINSSVLPVLTTQKAGNSYSGPGYEACGCGGTGWRRAAYLNMSDPTQTCPPAWELITTPRRSCARPSIAGDYSCYSAMFPTQGIQYSQVCGRIKGYQVGQTQAFFANGGLME